MDISSSSFRRNSNLENEINFSTDAPIKTGQVPVTLVNLPLNERASNIGTDSRHPMQPAPNHAAISPFTLNHKNVTTPRIEPYEKMALEIEEIHSKLIRVEQNAAHFNEDYSNTKKDPKKSEALKYLKTTSDWATQEGKIGGVSNLQKISEYQFLKGSRENTPLENKLPKNSNFRWKLNPLNGVFRDSKTGLYADMRLVNKQTNEYVLCFPGTGAGQMNSKQWSTNINQFLGKNGIPAAYEQAKKLAEELKVEIEKKGGTLKVAGHSLGGGIANYVGLKLNIKSFCFNAAPLGGACLQDLKDELSTDRIVKQNHIKQKGDIVSSKITQKKLSDIMNIFNKEKIFVPENIGVIHRVSAANLDDKETCFSTSDRHLLNSFNLLFDKKDKFNIETKLSRNFFPEQLNKVQTSAPEEDGYISDASDNSHSISLDTYLTTAAELNNLTSTTTTSFNTLNTTTTTTTTTTTKSDISTNKNG